MESINWSGFDTQTSMNIANPIIKGFGVKKAKEFEAQQLKRNANAIASKGNREANETRRKGKILASNARAAMGGSGGTTTDAGSVNQLSDIKQATDYNALSALFEAETQADSMKLAAKAKKAEGGRAMAAGATKSISTILKNSDKLFKPYKKET